MIYITHYAILGKHTEVLGEKNCMFLSTDAVKIRNGAQPCKLPEWAKPGHANKA